MKEAITKNIKANKKRYIISGIILFAVIVSVVSSVVSAVAFVGAEEDE